MLPNLRKCKNLEEFFSRLEKGRLEQSKNFLVWRSLENARTCAKARINRLVLDGKKSKMGISLDHAIQVAKGDTLYFYEEDSGALFKASVDSASGLQLEARLAGWPFLLEKRRDPRMEFGDVQYFLGISTFHQNMEKARKHEVALRNISAGGFAFTIGAGRAQRFQVGDKVLLSSIEGVRLPEPACGKIAHVSPLGMAIGSKDSVELGRQVLVGAGFDAPSAAISQTLSALHFA